MNHPHRPPSTRKAFTLVELLIVIAIIGLLAAILFPAFRRAQESAAQTNCASNLKQIYMAVELYRQDEKVYPASLAALLPAEFELDDTAGGSAGNDRGTGFFKGGLGALICRNDDTDGSVPHSSYGDISIDIDAGDKNFMSRYVWNYWGYRAEDEDGHCNEDDASGCAGTAYQTPQLVLDANLDSSWFADSNPAALPTVADEVRRNPLKYSLANRFAPTSTIITHCVFHRLPTAAGNLRDPFELTTEEGAMARDIVLRRDGSAKVLDVSQFHTGGNWAIHNF